MHKRYKKIMIFGRPGSGKSTFALWLSNTLQLPLYHLDKYFFESDWIERDYQEFLKIQQSLVEKATWIIDSNSTRSLEMRYSNADLVLYFNYPRGCCYFRVLKRLFNKNPAIDDRAPGCYEKVSLSLLRYMWGFEKRAADQIAALQKKYPAACLIEIRNDKQLKNLKNELTGF
jgi:adenylate kinase family enzyme